MDMQGSNRRHAARRARLRLSFGLAMAALVIASVFSFIAVLAPFGVPLLNAIGAFTLAMFAAYCVLGGLAISVYKLADEDVDDVEKP
jgi:hypothetical protein